MNLICYLFDRKGGTNLAAKIASLGKLLPIKRVCIVIHNKVSIDTCKHVINNQHLTIPIEYLTYSGIDWEFGAYQLGIDNLVDAGDGLIIMNDTIGRHYPLFRSDLSRFVRQVVAVKETDRPSVVGAIDSAGEIFNLCGFKFESWIRSNFFYINAAALKCLKHRVFDSTVFCAPKIAGEAFSINLPLSKNLQLYLKTWMSPNPVRGSWIEHSGRREITDAMRRDKTGSILLEKFLSARLSNSAAAFLSYCPEKKSVFYAMRVRAFFVIRHRLGGVGECVRRMTQFLHIAGN